MTIAPAHGVRWLASNVTIGLPIVRTSVDQGTAFDKAGEGRANPQSMVEAIKLAARSAVMLNPSKKGIVFGRWRLVTLLLGLGKFP